VAGEVVLAGRGCGAVAGLRLDPETYAAGTGPRPPHRVVQRRHDLRRDYREKTQPILDLLREKEMIVRVDATPAPDVVQAKMRHKLGLVPATEVESEEAGLAGARRR